jgi:hypothetical protein
VFQIALNPWPTKARFAFLREPAGDDELAPADASPFATVDLIGRLLVEHPAGTLGPAVAATMSLADRDRLVAGLYRQLFGDTVASQIACDTCGRAFEIDFSLAGLLRSLDDRIARPPSLRDGPDEQGAYTLEDGTRFRLPTVEDERALAVPGLAEEESVAALRRRCVLAGEVARVGEAVEAAMASLAPLVGTRIAARCPDCDAEQTIDFDMPSYFAAALLRERPILLRELHCLARAYGWSYAELLGMPRSQRRAFVALVLGEQQARELAT